MRYVFRCVILLFLLGVFAWVSCKKEESATELVSDYIRMSSFRLSNDTSNILYRYPFIIEEGEEGGYGKIYLPDSLPFGTVVDTIVPLITYAGNKVGTSGAGRVATPGSVMFKLFYDKRHSDDSISEEEHRYVYGDKFIWSQLLPPLDITVTSWDRSYTKTYRLSSIPIKKVNPDLFVWQRLHTGIYDEEESELEAMVFKGRLYVFKSDGLRIGVYISGDGKAWQNGVITGLPDNTDVKSIMVCGDSLFYYSRGRFYSSSDGMNWGSREVISGDYVIVTPLFSWIDTLWYIGRKSVTNQLEIVKFSDTLVSSGVLLPDNFPTSHFSYASFKGYGGLERIVVVGGLDSMGSYVYDEWHIEHSPYGGIHLQRVDSVVSHLPGLLSPCLINYGGKLYLLGGMQADARIRSNMYYSDNEGVSWKVVDSSSVKIPAEYGLRYKQSALLWDGDILLIGGQSKTLCYSDVFRLWINKVKYDWE